MPRYLLIAVLLIALVNSLAWSAPTLGIGEFANYTGVAEGGKKITDLITAHIAGSQDFSLVERQRINGILDEIGMGQTDIVNPETAAKVGHLVGAQYMLFGSLGEFQGKDEDEGRIWISIWLVQVKTARVINGWKISSAPGELDSKALELADRILGVQLPVSYWKTMAQSLFVPGWGQVVNDRSSGYVFLPLAILALSGLGYTQYAYGKAEDEYDDAWNSDIRIGRELERLQKRVDDRRRQRWIATGIVAGVWVANVVDTFLGVRLLNEQRRRAEEKLQWEAYVKPQGVRILCSMRF